MTTTAPAMTTSLPLGMVTPPTLMVPDTTGGSTASLEPKLNMAAWATTVPKATVTSMVLKNPERVVHWMTPKYSTAPRSAVARRATRMATG